MTAETVVHLRTCVQNIPIVFSLQFSRALNTNNYCYINCQKNDVDIQAAIIKKPVYTWWEAWRCNYLLQSYVVVST